MLNKQNNEIPKRYQTQSGKNFIDVLRDEHLTPEEFKGFLKGNALKYLFRYEEKGGKEDLEKQQHYVEMLKEFEYGK